MTLDDLAQQVLDVAAAAVPSVTRTLLAGGPELAKVCTQIAVFPAAAFVEAQSPGGFNGPAILGGCASVAIPGVTVAYTRDCYPMIEIDGKRVKIPPAAEVTAWSAVYMAHCHAILDALLEAKYDDTFAPCDVVRVDPTVHSGPTGGTCTMQVTVRVGP